MFISNESTTQIMEFKQGQSKEGKTVLYLVFEYMDTNLKKFIRTFRQTGQNVPPKTVKSLMCQLCKGVAFCHGHGILHRDLKPHNLLMDRKTKMLKIASENPDLVGGRRICLVVVEGGVVVVRLWQI